MRRQKEETDGQLMPWSAVKSILALRDETKVPNNLHARSRQLIEECADAEFADVVHEYLYGG